MTLLESYTILRDNDIKPTTKRGGIDITLNCGHIECADCGAFPRNTLAEDPCVVYLDNIPTEDELHTLEFQYKATKH